MEKRAVRLSKRQLRVRGKIPKEGYRLSVFRSNRYLFAQLIDQKSGQTILGFSDKKLLAPALKEKTKSEKAREFGEKFAQEVLKRKMKEIVFDRGPYRYHGRVRAFAEGLRKGGLVF